MTATRKIFSLKCSYRWMFHIKNFPRKLLEYFKILFLLKSQKTVFQVWSWRFMVFGQFIIFWHTEMAAVKQPSYKRNRNVSAACSRQHVTRANTIFGFSQTMLFCKGTSNQSAGKLELRNYEFGNKSLSDEREPLLLENLAIHFAPVPGYIVIGYHREFFLYKGRTSNAKFK